MMSSDEAAYEDTEWRKMRLAHHIATTTLALPNRQAWAAMAELLEQAGIPPGECRQDAWGIRKWLQSGGTAVEGEGVIIPQTMTEPG